MVVLRQRAGDKATRLRCGDHRDLVTYSCSCCVLSWGERKNLLTRQRAPTATPNPQTAWMKHSVHPGGGEAVLG